MSQNPRAEKPWSIHSPEGPWDVIVIGSGMGGMSCAALLACLGRRVLVLEQHYVPGGFTHTFSRKGYTWDVGVHAVGEVTTHSTIGRLLKRLTRGRLEWQTLGPVYDEFHYPDDFRIDFPDSPGKFRTRLLEAFPDEGPAIDGYLARVREVAGAMKGYYLARALPRPLAWLGDAVLARRAKKLLTEGTAEVIAKLTDNPRLRAVLAAQWGYYGSPPSRSSFAIQALVVKHFMHGGYYPVGGSARIAETLLGTVAEAGGWTRLRADVTEILIEGGRACGVRLASGEELRAPEIVSAAGVLRTMKSMLPESYRTSAWGQSLEALRPASAHVCLYIGFKGDITEAGASAANKWFYDTWDMEQEAWPISPDSELEDAPCLYTSFPSLKDPEHDPGPELRHTGEVVTFVPWESFEAWLGTRWKRRGDDYEAFKQRIQEKLLAQFLERMPGLADMVEYVELSTPLSTDTFCRPMRGSIYGIEPTPERFANSNLKPRSPLPGLTFAGSEVTAVGVIGALIGGVLAAASLAPIESFRFVKNET